MAVASECNPGGITQTVVAGAKKVAIIGAEAGVFLGATLAIQDFVLPLIIPKAAAATPTSTPKTTTTTTSGNINGLNGLNQIPASKSAASEATTSPGFANTGGVGGTGNSGTGTGNVTKTPANPGQGAAVDICQASVQAGQIPQSQLGVCQACESSLSLTGIDASKLSSTQIAALQSCLSANAAGTGTASSGTSGSSPTDTEQQSMTQDTASGANPCSDPNLSAPVAAACTQCYTPGMDSNTLIACVKQNLAQTSGASTAATGTVVGTLQQYAIPIAVGAVVVGIAAVVIYSGKKKKGGNYKPVATPPKVPESRTQV